MIFTTLLFTIISKENNFYENTNEDIIPHEIITAIDSSQDMQIDSSMINSTVKSEDNDNVSQNELFDMNAKHKYMINSQSAKHNLLNSDQETETDNEVDTDNSDSSLTFISPKHRSMLIKKIDNKPTIESSNDIGQDSETDHEVATEDSDSSTLISGKHKSLIIDPDSETDNEIATEDSDSSILISGKHKSLIIDPDSENDNDVATEDSDSPSTLISGKHKSLIIDPDSETDNDCLQRTNNLVPEAYVTVATNDVYAVGALVLGHSLHSVGTTRDLCILITPQVSQAIKSMLEGVFNKVCVVNILDSNDSAHLALLNRPELGVTFTKLHAWTLTCYSKCVFLDADILAVKNPDDLFQQPELSACCDIGWPDCFNSGMFVFTPNADTYGSLLKHAQTVGSFDGGDQGVLNTFFPNWNRVSFVYNMVASATYTYLPAYKQFGSNAKLVHFLGTTKPWQQRYDSQAGQVETSPGYQNLTPFLNSWWAIYVRLVQPGVPSIVSSSMSGLLINETPQEGLARWERDAFSNIKAYIDSKLKASGGQLV